MGPDLVLATVLMRWFLLQTWIVVSSTNTSTSSARVTGPPAKGGRACSEWADEFDSQNDPGFGLKVVCVLFIGIASNGAYLPQGSRYELLGQDLPQRVQSAIRIWDRIKMEDRQSFPSLR
jgi:hypothetical protein